MPKVGATVTTVGGETGTVIGTNPLKKTVRLRVENKDKDTMTITDYELKDIKFKPKNNAPVKDDPADDGDDLSELKKE